MKRSKRKRLFFSEKKEEGSFPSAWSHIDRIKKEEEKINWQEQWELFCPYFSEGVCNIPLVDFVKDSKAHLFLLPGAGFGDLSHETTWLMMKLTGQYVEKKIVVDLGCGSGVLGLFALLIGAKKGYSLDIDPKALEHTKENAKLNHLEDKVTLDFILPEEAKVDVLVLNMIFQEQKMALSSFPTEKCEVWITSGILKEQEKEYLFFMEKFSLKLEKMVEKNGWLAFVFYRSAGDIPRAAI